MVPRTPENTEAVATDDAPTAAPEAPITREQCSDRRFGTPVDHRFGYGQAGVRELREEPEAPDRRDPQELDEEDVQHADDDRGPPEGERDSSL